MNTTYGTGTINTPIESIEGTLKYSGSLQLTTENKFSGLQLTVFVNQPKTVDGATVDNYVFAGSANLSQNLSVNMNGNENSALDFTSLAPQVATDVLAIKADVIAKYTV